MQSSPKSRATAAATTGAARNDIAKGTSAFLRRRPQVYAPTP